MFCSKCGTKIDDDSRFCNGCGTKVAQVKNNMKQENNNKKDRDLRGKKIVKKTVIVSVIILLIGCVGYRKVRDKYVFDCGACQRTTIGQPYYSKAYDSHIICEDCIQKYFPDSWQNYYEIR